MRFRVLSSVCLLVTVWSVSSGVENSKNEATVVASLCPTCVNRIKTVINKAWTLTDPLAASYAVLTHTILKVEIAKQAVSFFMASYKFTRGSNDYRFFSNQ